MYVDIIEYLALLKRQKDYSLHYTIIKFEGNFMFCIDFYLWGLNLNVKIFLYLL